MVKSHHVPIIFIQIPYHKLHVIIISQRPNTSLIIIMNTPEQNAKTAGITTLDLQFKNLVACVQSSANLQPKSGYDLCFGSRIVNIGFHLPTSTKNQMLRFNCNQLHL